MCPPFYPAMAKVEPFYRPVNRSNKLATTGKLPLVRTEFRIAEKTWW